MIVHPSFKATAPAAVDLELTCVFSANGRRRTVYRIVADGQEVGTAIERADQPLKPWRLTLPGHCGNIARPSREELVATVARVLSTGAIWG
jgi:hypothetical protein